jgi:SepF-like predicted cell division protein (DUF552 family)
MAEDENEYIELPEVEVGGKKMLIAVGKLNEIKDVDEIIRNVRDGKMVFVNVKKLREKNLDELKIMISKLKKSCVNMNGNLVGLDENNLLAIPSFVEIVKE